MNIGGINIILYHPLNITLTYITSIPQTAARPDGRRGLCAVPVTLHGALCPLAHVVRGHARGRALPVRLPAVQLEGGRAQERAAGRGGAAERPGGGAAGN